MIPVPFEEENYHRHNVYILSGHSTTTTGHSYRSHHNRNGSIIQDEGCKQSLLLGNDSISRKPCHRRTMKPSSCSRTSTLRTSSSSSMLFILAAIFTVLCLLNLPLPSSGLSVGGVWSPRHDFVKVIAKFGFLKSDVHHKDRTDGYVFGNVTVISSSPYIKTIHKPVNDQIVIGGKLVNNTIIKATHNTSTNVSLTTKMPLTQKPSDKDSSLVDYNPSAALILIDRTTFINMIGDEDTDLDGTNGGRNPSLTCDKIFDQMNHGIIKIHDQYSDKCDNVSSVPSSNRDLVRVIPCPQNGPCLGIKPSQSHTVPNSQVTFIVEDQRQPT